MSCYNPLLGLPVGTTDAGKVKYDIVKSITQSEIQTTLEANPGSVVIPCGKCIGCRLDYSRSWADRMMLELEIAGKAVFLTLTYDNKHAHPIEYKSLSELNYNTLADSQIEQAINIDGDFCVPVSFNLHYPDLVGFWKRLRRRYDGSTELPELRIRYYAVGEYGDKTHRPHYHAIVFGLGLDDIPDLYENGRNDLGDKYYKSPMLCQVWSFGNVLVTDVSWNTCAYVARYVTKKLSGPQALTYSYLNCEPEKAMMSRRPGIGREYLDKYPDCLDYQSINISTPDGGRKIQIPKYYLKLSEVGDIMKAQRIKAASDRMLLKLQKSGLDYLDYLAVEEQNKKNSVKVLGRSKTDL